MVAIVHGSSHFTPIGATHVTGPTGASGGTGATGPIGYGYTGATGFSGGNITNMYLVDADGNATIAGDKLHTIFELVDENETRWTSSYTTTTRIKGPTGGGYPLIDGQNINDSSRMGVTLVQGRDSDNNISSLVLKVIEVTGPALSLQQNESLDTINIIYDPGNFGYLNIDGTDTDSAAGQLVGLSGSNLAGISGAKYDMATSSGLPSGANAIDVRVTNFTEKAKYLKIGADYDIRETGVDVPLYAPSVPIDPNNAKVFVLNMRQIDGISGVTGYTGEVSLNFKGASFGYTGNGPVGNGVSDAELAKAFSLVVHGATTSGEFPPWYTNSQTEKNIIWPLNKPPCWSGGTDIINFFWLPCEYDETWCPNEYAWHGNMVQWYGITGGTGNIDNAYYCYDDDGTFPFEGYKDGRNYYFGDGGTGACCMGKGICVHTTEANCPGYYNGTGTLCGAGGTGSSCYELGPCCVRNIKSKEVVCYENMSANECVDLADVLNYHTLFGGTANSCEEMQCENLKNEIGACCNGIGHCEQISKTNCLRQKKFFMGIGIPCVNKDDVQICSGGTGACCKGGAICDNNTLGSSCIEDGYLYAGHGSHCRDIDCRENSTTSGCIPEVAGLDLQPGDLYAGGMVVGLYHPDGEVGIGARGFGGSKLSSWESLMRGGFGSTYDNIGNVPSKYKSKYDWHSYGFDSKSSCNKHTNKNDAYYVIISLNPIGITGDRVVEYNDVDGITNEFYWGNRGSSWGPLYNQNLGIYEDVSNEYKYEVFPKSEGYWYDQNKGKVSLTILPERTFSSCNASRIYGSDAISKLKTKPTQTAHGMWHRNWGLYNTIRIISADNALLKGYYDDDGTYTGSDFGPGLTSGYVSAVRAVRLYDDNLISLGITGSNSPNISGWYLPSHDEFSYIANSCIRTVDNEFNLNSNLLEAGGTPLNGWHWTSTGAYDETKGLTAGIGEGIINPVGATGPLGVTADPGSLAWAIKINQSGNSDNFLVGKKNRTVNTYKVRPIRLVRCDGRYPSSDDSNYKLWKLPNIIRDEDKGINQRY